MTEDRTSERATGRESDRRKNSRDKE